VAVTAKKRAASGGDSTVSSGTSIGRFLREVYDELRKVVWPTWGELYRYTLVVIFTVIVLGIFIGGVDYLLGEAAKRFIYSGVTH
jgi:preprotein translocase subunit SecE